jgi:hypothetical protein
MRDIRGIIASFTERLTTVVETSVLERARASVLAILGGGKATARRRGRLPNELPAVASSAAVKPRKKAPPQLCPVPGCKNLAAPIFGMVCARHKDLPKATIRKYREKRRLAKLKVADNTVPTKRRAKKAVARKPKRAARNEKQGRKIPSLRKAAAKPTGSSTPPSSSAESPSAPAP